MADAPTHYLMVADNCAISPHSPFPLPLHPFSSSPPNPPRERSSSPRTSSTFGNLSLFLSLSSPSGLRQYFRYFFSRCPSLAFMRLAIPHPAPCILLPPASTWHPLTSFILVFLSRIISYTCACNPRTFRLCHISVSISFQVFPRLSRSLSLSGKVTPCSHTNALCPRPSFRPFLSLVPVLRSFVHVSR